VEGKVFLIVFPPGSELSRRRRYPQTHRASQRGLPHTLPGLGFPSIGGLRLLPSPGSLPFAAPGFPKSHGCVFFFVKLKGFVKQFFLCLCIAFVWFGGLGGRLVLLRVGFFFFWGWGFPFFFFWGEGFKRSVVWGRGGVGVSVGG